MFAAEQLQAEALGAGSHPVLSMFEASQPVLTGIVQIPSLQASVPVVSALCEVGSFSPTVVCICLEWYQNSDDSRSNSVYDSTAVKSWHVLHVVTCCSSAQLHAFHVVSELATRIINKHVSCCPACPVVFSNCRPLTSSQGLEETHNSNMWLTHFVLLASAVQRLCHIQMMWDQCARR